jgi:hypothetical protein
MQIAKDTGDQTDAESADIYGDNTGEWCFPYDDMLINDMATAIARIYTPDGFVIAADGREAHTVTGRVRSDEEQKIFHLRHGLCDMACVVTGTARIDSKQRVYRIGAELSLAANAIAGRHVNNLGEYVELLAHHVQISPSYRAIPPNDLSRAQPTILLLDGFVAGEPMRAKAAIDHNPASKVVTVNFQGLLPGDLIAFGSRVIYESLVLNPETIPDVLLPYRKICREKPRNMPDAIRVAQAFIQAHCDPAVRLIDPKRYAGIGGHVHVATITSGAGFQWAIPPLHPLL